MNVWLTIGGMFLVTYAARALPLLAMRNPPSPALERVLRYVPPSVFAALILPSLLLNGSNWQSGTLLWAGIFGVVVAYFSRNIALTIVAGLGAFALLRAIGF